LNRETYKTSTKKSLSKPRPARPVGNLGSHEKPKKDRRKMAGALPIVFKKIKFAPLLQSRPA
jgi:hypothetical protein